jgi:F-box interacting protein
MAADIPSDLFPEILSRLPVEPLLRFRSISKSLKSIIDSHNFTNLHLKNSNNFYLILNHNTDLYQLDFPNLTAAAILPLKHPFKEYLSLLGSCNGLIYISDDEYEPAALWNPIIRKHQYIPYLTLDHPYGRNQRVFHGFGFDPFTDDYKLIKIFSCIDMINRILNSHVRLFSSKTNSWKVLPHMLFAAFSAPGPGVLVGHSLHWVVVRIPTQKCVRSVFIVAFNLSQEIFNEVPLPDQIPFSEVTIDVSLLGECLCMTVRYQTINKVHTVDIWVMKEYGFRDSWCKLFTLDEPSFGTPFSTLKPLAYNSSSNTSKVLLQVQTLKPLKKDMLQYDGRKLFWFDLKTEKLTCVPGIPNFHQAMIYVGSLLPPSLPIDDNYNNYYRKKEKPQVEMQTKTQEKVGTSCCLFEFFVFVF